jgi:transcriptional regulator with XRE-family HTH domain
MTDFGNRLKQLLDERGVSQKWLADAANTKEATISRYINGVNKSSRIDILANIATALNVTTDYLLGLSETQTRDRPEYSTEERVLISAFRKASDRDVAVIWQLLDPYLSANEKELLSLLHNHELVTSVG